MAVSPSARPSDRAAAELAFPPGQSEPDRQGSQAQALCAAPAAMPALLLKPGRTAPVRALTACRAVHAHGRALRPREKPSEAAFSYAALR